jgi:hypothetical protein
MVEVVLQFNRKIFFAYLYCLEKKHLAEETQIDVR